MFRRSSCAPVVVLLVSIWLSNPASGQLTFNFTDTTAGGAPADVLQGFQDAGDLWSDIFVDNITINVEINYAALGSGVLGSTSNQRITDSYTNVFNALTGDSTSADDAIAVANLQAAPAFEMLLNRTVNSPNGANSATPFLDNDGDANNSTIRMSRSNAKAIGLLGGANTANDGGITFSSNFNWDFDRSDGITSGEFDFVAVAAHEIGHLLGFTSGVDILDGNPTGFQDNQFTWVNILDLYRFSDDTAFGVQMDWTADAREKYFSIDGGMTEIATFSTGRTFGDGQQASHWEDNLGIGLMDPTLAPGQLGNISFNDILAFDVAGYDLDIVAIPEPTGLLMFTVAGLIVATRRRRENNLVA